MPKALDSQRLTVTNSPTQRIDLNPSKLALPAFDPVALLQQWTQFFEDYGLQIISDLTGIDLTTLQSVLQPLIDGLDTITTALTALTSGDPAQLLAFFTNLGNLDLLNVFPQLLGAFDGIDITDPGAVLAAIEAAIVAALADVPLLGPIVQALFGVDGGADPLATLTTLGSNLMSMLGIPNLNPGGTFDPVTAGEQMLQNVLTPGGALSTFTQLPAHLLAELGIGQASTNLLPAGGFDDPSVVSGTSGWTYDATKGHTTNGSVWASGAGILRQMIGVAIGMKPGAITPMSCWTKWTGVTATAGAAICLCAIAYSDDAATVPISDPTNRVLAKITTPGSSSAGHAADSANGASAADANGWVQLSGQYQAPAGTVKVRLVLEVEPVVNAGSVGFDDCVQTIQTGILDASLFTNLENLTGQWPGLTIAGFQGIPDIIATLQHYTDGLGSAFSQDSSLSDIDIPTMLSLAQTQTSNAITAAFQAALHQVILGNRTNKSAGFGANPTSLASLTADAYSNNGTLTTISVTAGNAVGHRFTVPEFATYGFLEWQIFGTSLTNIFVNIYKINPTTNAKTALFNSSNISALIGTTNSHVRVLLPGMPQVAASDELLWEIVNNGTNALTVVYSPTAIPNNTNEVIQNTGWVRTVAAGGASPTSLTSGQGSYSGNVPYAVIGIVTVPANYQPPQRTPYSGSGHHTWTPPAWQANGDSVTLAGVGAGGGGGGSFNFVPGNGGGGGGWNGVKLIVGTHIKLGSTVDVYCGIEGAGGSSILGNGTPGETTVFTYTDPSNTTHTLVCTGGTGGSNGGGSTGSGAPSPNPFTFDLNPYFGGAAVGANTHGNAPGGGGGGGISYTSGAAGSDGGGWVTAAQP